MKIWKICYDVSIKIISLPVKVFWVPLPNQRTSLLRLTESPWTAQNWNIGQQNWNRNLQNWWCFVLFQCFSCVVLIKNKVPPKVPWFIRSIFGQTRKIRIGCVCVVAQHSVYNSSRIESWIMFQLVYSSYLKKLTLETLRDTFSRVGDFSDFKLWSRQVATNCLPFVLRKCVCSGIHHRLIIIVI